jgi:hypothetical protein
MKNQNRLTLKQLKADLDDLKKSKSVKLQEVNNIPESKKSRIINLFKQSSMLHLWLITAILGYARKLPFLSKIINLLSLWYGKSSWWKILGNIRKGFIIFNAIIGVLIMFQAVGFSFDNIIMGFMAMGHAYFEILGKLTNKLFGWFLNLFDQKIVPNVPNTKPSGGVSVKSPIDYILSPVEEYKPLNNPIKQEPYFSLRELYMKPSPNINITPWYFDTTNLLYLIGIGCSVGLFYVGYKIYSDPSWIYYYLASPTVTPGSPNPTNIPLPPESPPITITDNTTKSILSVGAAILKPFSYIKNKLNPFNYILSSSEVNNQYQTFMEYQNNPVTANKNYYPFTEINPYLPWYKKLKVAILGEGTFDALQRLKDKTYAERIYDSIKISKGKYTDVVGLTPADTPLPAATPNAWNTVGVGVKQSWNNFFDNLHHTNIENKFKTVTPIPKALPTQLPESILNDVTSWKNTIVEKSSIAEASDFVKEWKTGRASSSKVTLDGIPAHQNKIEFLKEVIE